MSEQHELRFRALRGVPFVGPGDDLVELHLAAAGREDVRFENGVLVVCQKIVSRAEGRVVSLRDVEPSAEARAIAEEFAAFERDARHIELVLRESKRIVRKGNGALICETRHGFVCANAGVDLSNAPEDDVAVLLPEDPDASARRLRAGLLDAGARAPFGVVITDTFGRPWREGLVDVALGAAGFAVLDDLRGGRDLRGRTLSITTLATPDALAAGAGLLMRKDAGVPSVWATGIALDEAKDEGVRALLREPETDLFR